MTHNFHLSWIKFWDKSNINIPWIIFFLPSSLAFQILGFTPPDPLRLELRLLGGGADWVQINSLGEQLLHD